LGMHVFLVKFESTKLNAFDISTFRYMVNTLKHLVSMQNMIGSVKEKPGEEVKESKIYILRVLLGRRTIISLF
jgi:hypothetical protein